jgi:hypothetical protein
VARLSPGSNEWQRIVGGPLTPVAACTHDGELIVANALAVWAWNGATWRRLGEQLVSGSSLSSVVSHDGVLYAGGNFGAWGGNVVRALASWNGAAWVEVIPMREISNVRTMAVLNGDLWVVGAKLVGQSFPGPLVLSGGSWRSIQRLNGQTQSAVCVFRGDVYLGGSELTDTKLYFEAEPDGRWANYPLVKWSAGEWKPVGAWDHFWMVGNIAGLEVGGDEMMVVTPEFVPFPWVGYGGDDYVGRVPRWAEGRWQREQYMNAGFVAFATWFNGHLVVASEGMHSWDPATGLETTSVVQWDTGDAWESFGASMRGSPEGIWAHDGGLFVFGRNLGPVGVEERHHSWMWRQEQWHPVRGDKPFGFAAFRGEVMASVMYATNEGQRSAFATVMGDELIRFAEASPENVLVWSMLEFNNELVVAGDFADIDGVPARGIASWDGGRWVALDRGLPSDPVRPWTGCDVRALVSLDDDLFALGSFQSTWFFARWDGAQWRVLHESSSAPWGQFLRVVNGRILMPGRMSPHYRGNMAIAQWGPRQGPSIVVHPVETSACPNSPTSLTVHATGTGPLRYQWRRDGQPLRNDQRIRGIGMPTLRIENLRREDVGRYDCVVSNVCGEVVTSQATIELACCADFDGDGDVGTDADIEAFFACLGGDCCPTCGSADFDGDGDTGTDADTEAFFRVLGGGAC